MGATKMTDGPTDWTDRAWVRIASGRRRIRFGRAARDEDVCRQCGFPWLMHPERYDPEDNEIVRYCSEYPVEPMRAIEACIAP